MATLVFAPHRQAGKQTDRLTDIYKQTGTGTEPSSAETDRHTDRQTDIQTNRQTETNSNVTAAGRQTDANYNRHGQTVRTVQMPLRC